MPRLVAVVAVLLGVPGSSALSQESPPGLLWVPGGETVIGSTVEDVERWIREGDPTHANLLAGETPGHTEDVDGFHLMVTEVTVEQYAAYVKATGAMPPFHWGAAAVEEARQAFLEKEAGRVPEAKKRRTWNPARWWTEHWTESEWAVPADGLALPITNVSHAEARAYARWAGLRLMTEQEYTRAARGDTARLYPWGDEWGDGERCNSVGLKLGGAVNVAGFPAGAVAGIHDLAGNVWEWTDSRYEPFPGYRMLTIAVGHPDQVRDLDAMAPFDAHSRVAVGGSYRDDALAVRVATRRATEPTKREPFLGFRCAASRAPGRDAAAWLLESAIDQSVVPDGLDFEPAGTVILQRWSTVPGVAGVLRYAVVTGHEAVLFCPVAKIPVGTKVELARESTGAAPVLLGFLSLDAPSAVPALPVGTYLVAWRSPGKLGEYDPLASAPGFDPTKGCLVFLDTAGLPVAGLPASESRFGRLREASTVELGSFNTLRFALGIPGLRREGFEVEFVLAMQPNTVDMGWK